MKHELCAGLSRLRAFMASGAKANASRFTLAIKQKTQANSQARGYKLVRKLPARCANSVRLCKYLLSTTCTNTTKSARHLVHATAQTTICGTIKAQHSFMSALLRGYNLPAICTVKRKYTRVQLVTNCHQLELEGV